MPYASIGFPDGIELFRRALADGMHAGLRMPLVNRDEFRAEAEANDGDIDFFRGHEMGKREPPGGERVA
jgi:hypothetical protein